MKRNDGSLERTLRAARPAAPELSANFAASVMAEAERQGLHPLPAAQARRALEAHRALESRRWLPLAAAAVLLVGSAVLLNGLLFELNESGVLELLYFGERFLGGFLTRLPWDLLAASLLPATAAGWLLSRGVSSGPWGWRVPVTWAVLLSYGLTTGGGVVLAVSGVNEALSTQVEKGQELLPGLDGFYRHRARYARPHPNFRMGTVEAVEDDTVVLLTPSGERERAWFPPHMRPQLGQQLRLSGHPSAQGFRADAGQVCEPRRVRHYFRHPMGPGMMDPGMMGPRGGPDMERMHQRMMGPGMLQRGEGTPSGGLMERDAAAAPTAPTGTPSL